MNKDRCYLLSIFRKARTMLLLRAAPLSTTIFLPLNPLKGMVKRIFVAIGFMEHAALGIRAAYFCPSEARKGKRYSGKPARAPKYN